ncbi:hypothetical protein TSUD_98350 [Trifolium subterraneum]|uniref:Uncharacterized protein n=1 Tax=Trifolium subterraneum TaxID=3900 RepID=A0A2Z6PAW2_TRISU|nr:hypothetical protein TSUD_98350 [Trifolium subterraneum]
MTTENNTVTVNPGHEQRPKVVVITGPTGSGKSKLAVDLASNFSIEVINADSMQVYSGLDILTNKLPFSEQNGVPHHLLGTVNPNFEFTAKAFRDSAIPALVSSFLLDDSTDDLNESYLGDSPGITGHDNDLCSENDSSSNSYDFLKDIDPVAANRIHPNNHRKINQYVSLYSRTGVLPSKVFQGQAAEKWGQADNLRYDCCFISVDASIPVLDRYVEQRVDDMMDAGLLNEVYDIYTMNADYTRGLRQAIGVREFEDLLRTSVFKNINKKEVELIDRSNLENSEPLFHGNLLEWLRTSPDTKSTTLLEEAIEKVKVNTRRLVRRQKRMLSRLQTLFGWDIHYVDSTESILNQMMYGLAKWLNLPRR